MNGLILEKVNAEIGNFKLKNINLKLPKGAILGLVGRNGAGKTTLFKTINGTYLKKAGKLIVNGYEYKNDELKIRESLTVVYDTLNVNPFAKGKFILKIFKKLHPHFDSTLFESLINKFQIDINMRVREYSLGTIRKFMLILALSTNPKILLLDEPLIGIDPIDKTQLIDLFQKFMENEDNTMVLSSHQIEDIEKIADYIAFINDGEIILYEEKETLLDKYGYVSLTSESKDINKLISPKKSIFGFEGLMTRKNITDLKIEFKRATIEQIFIHLCSWGEKIWDILIITMYCV